VFAPVVRASTVRLFFRIVAAADLVCHMVDISDAFVQGTADKVIFMCQPPGFEDGTGNVLKLIKSLYGLKQALRVWNQTLTNLLLSIGCVRSQSDGALFTLCLPSGSLVYVLQGLSAFSSGHPLDNSSIYSSTCSIIRIVMRVCVQ
jgi:hypothetical protein